MLTLSDRQKKALLALARFTIDCEFYPSKSKWHPPDDPVFAERRGVFVTLKMNGELRGCIGSIVSEQSIDDGVRSMAIKAAFQDPRFMPLSVAEWARVSLEISVLSHLIPVNTIGDIQVGRDGLLLRRLGHSGVLLPKVAVEWGWNAHEFVAHVFQKAGLSGHQWAADELFRFEAEEFGE